MLKTKEFTVGIEKIDAGENPLRLEGKNKGIDELAESISRIGLINPLVVVPENGRYSLIAGHRMFAACRRAGLKEVQVCIVEGNRWDICEIALEEYLFSKDLSPVETAVAVVALIKEGGMNRQQVANICRRSTAWVQEQEEIVSWPADVQQACHEGWLSVSAASNLALVEEDDHRKFLLSQAEEHGATARTTAAWLQAWRSSVPLREPLQLNFVPVPIGIRAIVFKSGDQTHMCPVADTDDSEALINRIRINSFC